MLTLVVLAIIFVGQWLEDILPITIFTLSSSDSVLPKLLTIFEDSFCLINKAVYTKQNNNFRRIHCSGKTLG